MQNHDDEGLAAEALQNLLIPSDVSPEPHSPMGDDVWQNEMVTLEAIFDDRFSSKSLLSCSVKLQLETGSEAVANFRRPSRGYPTMVVPILTITSHRIPAYIRLSATKQAIMAARETLLGDSMVFGLVEWLEGNIARVMQDPGSLMELTRPKLTGSAAQHIANNDLPMLKPLRREARNGIKLRRADEELRLAWEARQRLPAQQKMLESRKTLPAWSKQSAIVEAVQNNQCVIISGETGSGKSTQSVQFILDHLLDSLKGSLAKIVCTQPRRISALGLSDRVSAERCSREGQEVGYIIRG